jgi:hypothetical protein
MALNKKISDTPTEPDLPLMPIQDLLTRWMRNGDLVQSATISLQHNEKSLLAWGRPHKLDQVLSLPRAQ